MPDSDGDSAIVTRILISDAMCVRCLVARSGLDLDRVLRALVAIEDTIAVIRVWGTCPIRAQGKGAVLMGP